MSRPTLLKTTQQQIVTWFTSQDNDLQWQLMTTPFDGKTQLARFRRLFVKTMNDNNIRKLKLLTPTPSQEEK